MIVTSAGMLLLTRLPVDGTYVANVLPVARCSCRSASAPCSCRSRSSRRRASRTTTRDSPRVSSTRRSRSAARSGSRSSRRSRRAGTNHLGGSGSRRRSSTASTSRSSGRSPSCSSASSRWSRCSARTDVEGIEAEAAPAGARSDQASGVVDRRACSRAWAVETLERLADVADTDHDAPRRRGRSRPGMLRRGACSGAHGRASTRPRRRRAVVGHGHRVCASDDGPRSTTRAGRHGLVPAGEGGRANAASALVRPRPRGALGLRGDGVRQVGVNLFVLGPGEPISMYHWEADQEDFLVAPARRCSSSTARNARDGSGTSSTCPPACARASGQGRRRP